MLMTESTPKIIKQLEPNNDGKKEVNDDKKILRNAVIEGAWAVMVFVIGSTAMQLQHDPITWVYGVASCFGTGFIGYLVKAYKLGGGSKE